MTTNRSERNTVTLGKAVQVDIDCLARQITPGQLGDLITQFVNTQGYQGDAVSTSAAIQQAHPTLQASAVRFLLQVVLEYRPSSTDLRNEAAQHVAARLRQANNDDPSMFYIPLI